MADIDRMTSTELAWHERNNAENLKAALAPPPPPPPPTAEESLAQQRSAKVKELQPQYKEWLTFQEYDKPGSLTWDMFIRDHAMRLFLEWHGKQQAMVDKINADVERFLAAHPEYISAESNRAVMNRWLRESDLPASFENFENAFTAVKEDLVLNDPNKPESRFGVWRNGQFIPNEMPDNSSGTTRQFNMGQSTPGASNQDVDIDKRPEQMNSTEFAEACRVSKTFRAKMDG